MKVRLDPLLEDLGQGLVEYGLILSLMAVVAVLTLVFFGSEVSVVLDIIARAVDTPG